MANNNFTNKTSDTTKDKVGEGVINTNTTNETGVELSMKPQDVPPVSEVTNIRTDAVELHTETVNPPKTEEEITLSPVPESNIKIKCGSFISELKANHIAGKFIARNFDVGVKEADGKFVIVLNHSATNMDDAMKVVKKVRSTGLSAIIM